jgi:1-acyl-sn-glycerol-3-phosphate acyltransferase
MLYGTVRAIVRLLLRIFYRRIEVVGLEHLPAAGPVIVVANHHNGAIDGALLMTVSPRPLAMIVKAPLFRNAVLGFLLRRLKAIPAHRRQDTDTITDPARNAEMFSTAGETLARGGAILIFPEGTSHEDPTLRPLRTGVARLALGASVSVRIVPVGLVFDAPSTLRGGDALVVVGEPVKMADLRQGAEASDEDAVRTLTERVSVALRRQMVEADDRETIRLAELVDRLWRGASVNVDSPIDRLDWTRRVLQAGRYLDVRDPGRVARLRHELELYAAEIDADGEAPESYATRAVLRRAAADAAALLLALPLAVVGLAIHVVPYQLTRWLVRVLRPDPDMEATAKLTLGALLFPLWWAAEAVAIGAGAGAGAGAARLLIFLAILVPSGLVALTWQERLARARRDLKGFVRFVVRPDRHRSLIERRRQLIQELRTVADAVFTGFVD